MYSVIFVIAPSDASSSGQSQSGALLRHCNQRLIKMSQSTSVRLSERASDYNIVEAHITIER